MKGPMKKLIALLSLSIAACAEPAQPPAQTNAPTSAGAPAQQKPAQPAAKAKIGQPAPEFSLPDLDGKQVKLSDYKGKTVVLEWFNPGCPFVQRSHREGGLKGTAARHTAQGVVWLAINSGAAGKQGHGKETNVKAKADFSMGYPILLDEDGAVGRSYGARKTPHMYIVDPKGILVYAGAIDNTEGGEPEKDDTVINFVDVALGELAAGKPISKPETEAFGCTVKY
jgi:peroxiredoxin